MNRFILVLLIVSAAGCANLCQRKDSAMLNKCAGVLAYTPDPICPHNLENCSPPHLEQFRGYVECLESMGVCSLDATNACASRFPGGVNLMCPKRM